MYQHNVNPQPQYDRRAEEARSQAEKLSPPPLPPLAAELMPEPPLQVERARIEALPQTDKQENSRANVREVLSDFYLSEPDAKRVAKDAGLDISRIDFGGSAINYWESILTEAEKNGCVGTLINVAKKDYSNNPVFNKVYEAYLLQIEEKIKQAQPSKSLLAEKTVATAFTLTIEGDFDNFQDSDRQHVATIISLLLSLKGSDVTITKKSRGSVVLSIELPRNKVDELYRLIKLGKLDGVDVKQIDLSKVNFQGLDLSKADLRDAILRMADLRGTDLTYANLDNAELDQAIYDKGTRWPEGFDPDKRGALLFEHKNVVIVDRNPKAPNHDLENLPSSEVSEISVSAVIRNSLIKLATILKYALSLVVVSVVTCVVLAVCLIVIASIVNYLNIQVDLLLWLSSGFTVAIISILWLIRSNRQVRTNNLQFVFSITAVLVALAVTIYIYWLAG